jgi:hypothetical protein
MADGHGQAEAMIACYVLLVWCCVSLPPMICRSAAQRRSPCGSRWPQRSTTWAASWPRRCGTRHQKGLPKLGTRPASTSEGDLKLGRLPASTSEHVQKLGRLPASAADPSNPLDHWAGIGPGLKEMMGSDAPPAAAGIAQVTIAQPSPGRTKLPPCPTYAGYPVMSPEGQAWVSRRNAARFGNEPFQGQPPYDRRGCLDTATSHRFPRDFGCSDAMLGSNVPPRPDGPGADGAMRIAEPRT